MKDSNTLSARHYSIIDGNFVLDKKEYKWHIPKVLRPANIKKGDVVLVRAKKRKAKVIVSDVFREDVEDTGKLYAPVLAKLETPEEVIEAMAEKYSE